MITRLSAAVAVLLFATPAAFAATADTGTTSTTTPQAGAVTTAPGGTANQAQGQKAMGRQHNRQASRFEAMDKNHDGAVDLSEWKAAGRKEAAFNRMDADHDGKLTQAEMQSYRTAHAGAKRGGSTAQPATSGTSQ